jgi:hypothetical protein
MSDAQTDVPFQRLLCWRNGLARAAEARGEPTFMNLPDAWYDDPHWFCASGHVSHRYLKAEEGSRALCLSCRCPVALGPAIGEREFAVVLQHLATGQLA